MQEWIIAMLAISILLILRDMAKTVLKGRKSRKEEPFPLGGEHPQKEKVERYAASFQKLADTFYGMPYKKEYLSSAQVENVIRETGERSCRNCYRRELCWGDHAEEMYLCGEAMVRAIEQADEEKIEEARKHWGENCGRSAQYLEALKDCFQKEKQEMIWGNRMIESRLAVAQQLNEISHIMQQVAEDLSSSMGTGYEMTAIACAVLGGVSTNGGKGKMWGPIIATFIMAFLTYALGLMGIDPNTKKIVIGVILIVTILISTINKQMIKDIKLRLFYHNNKNIEAINDRTAAAVKDMKKQIKELEKGNASDKAAQIEKLNKKIEAAQKECKEKSAQWWAEQQENAKKAKERFK